MKGKNVKSKCLKLLFMDNERKEKRKYRGGIVIGEGPPDDGAIGSTSVQGWRLTETRDGGNSVRWGRA